MDVAKLVFEIDSSSAITAEKNLDKLAKTSDRVEASVRKVKTASEMAGIGIGAGSSATDRATRSAMQHAQALSQAERAMRSTIEVYGTAFNAQGRYTTSVGANTAMLLQNARASAALEKEQAATARAVQRLTSAYDPLGGEILKANAQLRDAEKLFAKGAYSAGEYARATDGLRQKIGNLETAHASGVRSSNALQNATLNLGRQFTDIGVQLAGGQNPFLVLTQQLPQIIDGLQVAKMGGLGFRQVLAGIGATLAPFLPAIIAIGTVATVAFGGAALAARSLSDDNKKLVASLGLTEKQLEHLKDKGVETGITIGDVFKGTFNYIKGAVAPTLAPVMKWFGELFDSITKGAVITVKAIVGGFAGAFAGVKAIWADLPAVMGDLFASGANLAISAIEKLLNFATAGINSLIEKANAVSAKVNGPQIGTLGGFSLGRVDNPNAGAASRAGTDFATAGAAAAKKAADGVDKVFADIGKSITKVAEDRIKKAAGDADKSSKAKTASETRDMSEERSAQIAAQLEQALADELRARLSMAKEVKDRAEIERQIASATASAKQSRIDVQIASIADDKGLSDLKKAELTLELQRIKFIEGGIADIQRRAIDEKERADLFQRDLELAQAASANEVDILNSRKGLAQSSYEASRIERQILDKTYAAERDRLTKIIANKDTDAKTLTESQGRLVTIEEIHKNELRQLELSDNAVTAYADLVGALSNAARAVIDGDIGGSISAAGGVFKQLSGLAGGLGTSLGSALGSAAAYAGPIGAAVSAVTGVLGAIGDKSAAKAQAKLDALNKSVEALRTDNKTSSGSISGALEEANKAWNADLEYSSAMVTSLRSIDNQIGALANALSRSITAGGLLSTSTLGLGKTGGGGLFGSSSNAELLDQGLAFNPTTYGQGVTGSTYADIVSTTTKKFLGVTTGVKVRNSTVSGAIDPSLLSQINGIIEALGNGVLSAASVFGVEAAKAAESALGSAVVDLGKLSLKDLKPDEIAAVLQATFDKVGDQIAAAGVPGLDKLATVGEGSFETLTRLAREYQVVDTSLAALGKTFGQVGLESLAARDNLVQLFGGLDAFTSATSFFASNFLTDAEQLAPVIKAVNDNLAQFGLSATSTRDQFKSLVLAQDLTTESGRNAYAALLAVAPAFDKVASASEDTAAKAIEAAKTRTDYEAGIQAKIDELTLTDAQKRERELAAALAVSEKAGELTKQLWALEDAAAATAKATEDAAKAADRQSALADLYEAQGRTAEATALRRAQALAAITDPLQRAYQEMTYAATDAAQKVTDARSVLTDAYNAEKSAIEATRSKFADLAKTLRDFSGSLTSSAIDALDPIARRNATLSAFQDAASRARLGDSEAAALIPKLGEEFRTASEAAASSQIDYLRDLSYIRRATDDAADTAERQVSAADRQLEALNASVAGLININQSVISVQQAIADLTAATMAAKSAGVASVGGSSLGLGSTGGLSTDPKSATGYNAQMAYFLTHGMAGAAGGGDPAYVALGNAYKPSFGDVANVYGVAEALRQQQAGLVKFATGGSFGVPSYSGTDTNVLSINDVPTAMVNGGETVNVSRKDVNEALLAAVDRMARTIESQAEDIKALKSSNAQMAQDLRNVTQGGTAILTEAA